MSGPAHDGGLLLLEQEAEAHELHAVRLERLDHLLALVRRTPRAGACTPNISGMFGP